CSNMYAISTYRQEPDEWPYESNKRIALAAEAAGFDFLFPVSRWRGFGGETDYLGTSLETMTLAAALLAGTPKNRCYSTVLDRPQPGIPPLSRGEDGCDTRPHQQRAVGDQHCQRLE